mmetsp:Transcript_6611/g.5708  ORF Transcript_6611/g.5708 Transcript_6611/m.5708 type:complete len:180 (+) Transcript_6611:26-565(+)
MSTLSKSLILCVDGVEDLANSGIIEELGLSCMPIQYLLQPKDKNIFESITNFSSHEDILKAMKDKRTENSVQVVFGEKEDQMFEALERFVDSKECQLLYVYLDLGMDHENDSSSILLSINSYLSSPSISSILNTYIIFTPLLNCEESDFYPPEVTLAKSHNSILADIIPRQTFDNLHES